MAQIKVGDVVHVPALADGWRKRPYSIKVTELREFDSGNVGLHGEKLPANGSGSARRRTVRMFAIVRQENCTIIEKGK